jgi:malate synthase
MDSKESPVRLDLIPHRLVNDAVPGPAADFLRELADAFGDDLRTLLQERQDRKQAWSPGFLPETTAIRKNDWQVAATPAELADRRVEITGPPDRKMIINALNSGAKVYMADFEDSLAPTWEAVLEGQLNLSDAAAGTIEYEHPIKGTYRVKSDPAVLFVRPRGLHLEEAHCTLAGVPISASLFDFGLYVWHNAAKFSARPRPYFYLPKLEHWHEAAWWNRVFDWAEARFNWPVGWIRATVLIETLPAAFQMHEILWALRDHSAGLNCGRWDYIFSYIKCFAEDESRVTPDRSLITMQAPFMEAYSKLLIDTCHVRGCHAMGGMAAQIPIKGDDAANEAAMNKVRYDKLGEVMRGHDGTWVAHPGLVGLALGMFDEHMTGANQISGRNGHSNESDVRMTAKLTRHPEGIVTAAGLRQNIEVGVRYLAAWLGGSGCVPLHHLMEDAATAEISRTQVWQWIHHGVKDVEGVIIDATRLETELQRVSTKYHAIDEEAIKLFRELCMAEELPEFLTTSAYPRIIAQ